MRQIVQLQQYNNVAELIKFLNSYRNAQKLMFHQRIFIIQINYILVLQTFIGRRTGTMRTNRIFIIQ